MNLGTDILPDGTLTRRTFCSKRIETVTKVNADGDTIVRNVTRTTSNIHDYMGSFWTVRGETQARRVVTSTGYVDLTTGKRYWYVTNRQGSTMAVVDETGAVVQRNGYYPSGTPYVLPSETDAPSLTAVTDRLHIGNRWLSHSGLNQYDNMARMHDPLLMRFATPDPLVVDFPDISPWSHCAANPVNAVDPDGRTVIADEWCQQGHCYLLCLKDNDSSVNPWHDTKYTCVGVEYDEEYGMNSPIFEPVDHNITLVKRIDAVTQDVIRNYNLRQK